MEKDNKISLMMTYTSDSITKENLMEMDNTFGRMDPGTRDNSRLVLDKEMECFNNREVSIKVRNSDNLAT
jgi:hypothetical protein